MLLALQEAKNSKSYDNRHGETSSNVHLEPRDYQINYVNNIIDQRHQYGVLVEGPTSLASVAGGIV